VIDDESEGGDCDEVTRDVYGVQDEVNQEKNEQNKGGERRRKPIPQVR